MDLGWTADGIERAEAAGGITLEVYQRPGFTGGRAVRVRPGAADASGQEFDVDDDQAADDDA